jgi:hypothetical protein
LVEKEENEVMELRERKVRGWCENREMRSVYNERKNEGLLFNRKEWG